MPPEPGSRLANYEILELIGEGGMGRVYRAREQRLDRTVAIKVLPDELTRDRDRVERFEREARLLSQLNHPNVATLYGFEEAGGQPFLVMELVEGETLADRLRRGPIPLEEAIPLFVRIAEGLEAAHEKRILHNTSRIRSRYPRTAAALPTPHRDRIGRLGCTSAPGTSSSPGSYPARRERQHPSSLPTETGWLFSQTASSRKCRSTEEPRSESVTFQAGK